MGVVSGREEKWGGRRWVFTVFLFIFILHCFAILFFIGGFLLTRIELPHYSRCSDVFEPSFPCNRSQNHENSCWTKPAVDRLVIIVLDALSLKIGLPALSSLTRQRRVRGRRSQLENRVGLLVTIGAGYALHPANITPSVYNHVNLTRRVTDSNSGEVLTASLTRQSSQKSPALPGLQQ